MLPSDKRKIFGKLLCPLPPIHCYRKASLQSWSTKKHSYPVRSDCGSVPHTSTLEKKELTNEVFHTYLLELNYLLGQYI